MSQFYSTLTEWYAQQGLNEASVRVLTYLTLTLFILLLSVLANFIARRILLHAVAAVIRRSKNKYDDIFLERKVFNRLSHLAPAMVISLVTPILFPPEIYGQLAGLVETGVSIYLYVVGGLFASAFVAASAEAYQRFDPNHPPVRGYVQAFYLLFTLIVGVLIVAEVTGQTAAYLLSGIGALTAIVLLVFKDTILGFVAGIQLASNKMVRPGDWITVPSANADGDVIDVTLTTVKIRNWDKTIAYVPVYTLISESFVNWRGMSESGGRRIKRAIHIDMTSINFLDEVQVAQFQGMRLLKSYMNGKLEELEAHHERTGTDPSDPLNSRRLTNLGTFRAYVAAYLRDNSKINQEMTFLVRQLPSTDKGLPLEIYVFSADQRWAFYEDIQADIFDHLFAMIGVFGLRVYQSPGSYDLHQVSKVLTDGHPQSGRTDL